MRILIINSFYFPEEVGGAERSLKILADALVCAGHVVAVLATGTEVPTPEFVGQVRVFRRRSENAALKLPAIVPNPIRKAVFHIHNTHTAGAMAQVLSACNEFRPDVVHTNNLAWLSVAVWKAATALRIPIVHTLRDYALLCANYGFFRKGKPCGPDRCWQCRALSAHKIAASQSVDVVVGNSQFTLDRHVREGAFPQAQKCVIYNGYRAAGLMAPRQHPSQLGQPFVVGFIGQLSPHKGVELLVNTFANLLDGPWRGNDVRLLVAGDGDAAYVACLRQLAMGLPIEFLGVAPQGEFFQRVSLCVVPSLWDEPLSRVLFESFAHGVPVLASATGGSSELIKDGVTGWLFDINQPGHLATKLMEARASPQLFENISKTSLALSSTFRPERVVDEYLKVYQSAISGA